MTSHPFTTVFLNGRLQWVLWRTASNRRQLRASSPFTCLTDVLKMFGYSMYNVTLRRARATIIAVEKPSVLQGRSVCATNKMMFFTIVWPCIVTDSLWIKTNRCTEFHFYWYYDSTSFGQPFCSSSGVAPGSKRSSQLQKMYQSHCTAKNSW
jgi:hypothetical protein